MPWELCIPTQFDARTMSEKELHEMLVTYNNSNYKPWSTIRDKTIADKRISSLVQNFFSWFHRFGNSGNLEEALWSVNTSRWNSTPKKGNKSSKPEQCVPDGSTWVSDRIDHVFVDENFRTENAFVVYSKANWSTLDTISDHPGIVATFTWTPTQYSEWEYWQSPGVSLETAEKGLPTKKH